MSDFSRLLEEADNFKLRRTVERLREGLFDPFGVQLLTARESQLNKFFDQGARKLNQKKATHLCVCGSYGQGKSHSLTYIRQRALKQGFVTSQINLDPREVPFHDFSQVYRALVERISFPGNNGSLAEFWKEWLEGQKNANPKNNSNLLDIIPDSMPHFFKSVLTALAQENMVLSRRQKGLKKHLNFRPREFPWLLANALQGGLPVFRLRHALKYRQVDFYKDESLACKGWEPYFEAVNGLATMFQRMGFKGWVILFDEGESIGQLRVNMRRKSYAILDRFFNSASPQSGLYPIFAFTDDFFQRVKLEDYDRVEVRAEQESLYFAKNYGATWRNLNLYPLHDLSAGEWKKLLRKLILLHAGAYNWQPPKAKMQRDLAATLTKLVGQEARLKIKGLVDQLDFAHQKLVLGGH